MDGHFIAGAQIGLSKFGSALLANFLIFCKQNALIQLSKSRPLKLFPSTGKFFFIEKCYFLEDFCNRARAFFWLVG